MTTPFQCRRRLPTIALMLSTLAATVSLATSPTAAQDKAPKAADPLVILNKLFRTEYAAARKAFLARSGPIIVCQFDQLVLFHNGGKKVENFTPAIYHEVKALAHLPLTLYVALARHTGKPLDDATVGVLTDLRGRVVAAEKSLAGRPGWTEALLKNNRQIVTASLSLIDAALKTRTIDAATLQGYARRMRPPILRNTDVAAAAQLGGLHALVGKWRKQLGEAAWKETTVIVLAPRQARPGSLQYAYFQRYLGWRAEGRRLFYGENVFAADAAVRLLGTILLDKGASVAFFGNPRRLERDMLSDAAAIHVRRLIPGTGAPPPKAKPPEKK